MSEISFLEKALLNPNCKAFLDTLALSEGADYDSLFGDGPNHPHKFTDFSRHPNITHRYTDKSGKEITTTAAGKYQFIHSTWEGLRIKLSLPDFGHHSQDLGALELLSEKNVVQKLMNGDFAAALEAGKEIWASLPGANDNQPERSIATVTKWYQDAGGEIA